MKTSIKPFSLFILFFSCTSFYGCVSDDIPSPVETEFLLSKIYSIPDYGSQTPYLRKEYKYNKFNKPWISVGFNSIMDTMEVAKYFYDNNNRFVEVHNWYGRTDYSPQTAKYYYDSLNRISRIEEKRSVGRVLKTYTYTDTTIVEANQFLDAGTEYNVFYTLDRRGNFIREHWRAVNGYLFWNEYGDFDNSRNIFSFTKVEPSLFHNVGISSSKNNPGWVRSNVNGKVSFSRFVYTHNEDHLVIRRTRGIVVDSFQYIKVKKVN